MPLNHLKKPVINAVIKLVSSKVKSMKNKLIKENPDFYEYEDYQIDRKCCEVSKEYEYLYFALEELTKDANNMR